MMSQRMPFTADDLSFLSQVLGKVSGKPVAVDSLIQDEQTLEFLLDLPAVKDTLLDDTGCLRVSPRFYFYILIRDVLQRGKIKSREICHYLAEILEGFSKTSSLVHSGAQGTSNFAYLSDLMIALQKLPPAQSYQLRVHLGNYSLFMTGIFHERLEFQSKRHGAPGLRFYESIGQSAYRIASENHYAKSEKMDHLLHDLSDGFHEVRVALNQLTEKTLHFHGHSYDLDAGNTTVT
ncbi:MAG: hypothetical protein V4507_00530 [Verrucomicrobiota bacterium]